MMNLKPVSKDVIAAVAFLGENGSKASFQVTDNEVFFVHDGEILGRCAVKNKEWRLAKRDGKWSIEESVEVETLPDGTRRIVT